jgi:hypothetical protein
MTRTYLVSLTLPVLWYIPSLIKTSWGCPVAAWPLPYTSGTPSVQVLFHLSDDVQPRPQPLLRRRMQRMAAELTARRALIEQMPGGTDALGVA